MTEVAALYRRAIEEFGRRVARIRDDQWHDPTPCTEWDVRMLVGHLVYENLWFAALVRGETIPEVGGRFEGDNLGDDPKAAWDRASADATAVADEPGALDRSVGLSRGEVPAAEYAWEVVMDHTIHAWDLAKAIGADTELDPVLVDALWGWLPDHLDRMRASGGFADPVGVTGDASDQDRLLAELGRHP